MKRAGLAIAAISIIALAFGAGAITAIWRGWGDGTIQLTLVNDSEQTVASLVVHHESCGTTGTLNAGSISPNGSRLVDVRLCGEGTIAISGETADGRRLSTQPYYVMSGYNVTQHLSRNGLAAGLKLAL